MTHDAFVTGLVPQGKLPTHLMADAALCQYWRLAYHEAGHAIATLTLGYEVRAVEIRGGYDYLGRAFPRLDVMTTPLDDMILIKLAGPAAETKHFPVLQAFLEFGSYGHHDLREAAEFISIELNELDIDSPAVLQRMAWYRARAESLVARHWRWIDRAARRLGELRRLSGADVLALRAAR